MLRKMLMIGGVAIATLSSAQADNQNIRTLHREGSWTTYVGRTDENSMVCGMAVDGPDKSLYVKWYDDGGGTLTVHAYKDGWQIPTGTEMRVTLGFDADTFGSTTAVGGSKGGRRHFVEFQIAKSAGVNFLRQFAEANEMWLTFPDGNEVRWIAKMNGSRVATKYMWDCMTYVWGQKQRPTSQPYGNQASSPTR